LKVLLTGANGFVGSHVLDQLRTRRIPTVLLLRPASDKSFIQPHLPGVQVCNGSITDLDSLSRAMAGISHVIHCAGLTKALSASEFSAVNQGGTRNVVTAANSASVQRLVHVSSLAAIGPAKAAHPAREDDPPHPVSQYGRSKLEAETEVSKKCQGEFVILRPPAVYGPRDKAFLSLFKAVGHHLLPRTNSSQDLSLVFVEDLAEVIVASLEKPVARGRAYFVAAPEVVTGRQMAEEIAGQIGHWTVPLPLPVALFWPVCLFRELWARIARRASLLNLQKFAELRAPGWVCDPSRLKQELGLECRTLLQGGIAQTLSWYRSQGWL
jgi:nucleoside-diphosphate-sugar epimerase